MKNLFSFSIGTIAKKSEAKSKYAEIYLKSESYSSGVTELSKENALDYEFDLGELKDKYKTKVKDTVVAKWLPLGNQNRYSSPELTGGETVLVIKILGVDDYYFVTLFSDLDMKAQEIVEYLYPSRPMKSDEDRHPDYDKDGDELSSSYRLLIDTNEESQQVLFRTSKMNNERAVMSLMVDAKYGKFLVYNDEKEIISLETSSAEDPEEDPGRIRMATNGEFLQKVAKSLYLEFLESEYKKVTQDVFTEIGNDLMERIKGKLSQEVTGEVNLDYKDKFTLVTKGETGIKSDDKIILQSNSDIGLTSVGGKLKLFSTDIGIIAPKVGITSPNVAVTGTLMAAAISMGGSPDADATPLQIKPNPLQWDKFDEEMEKITEKNVIKNPDEAEEEEKEKKEEKEEEEKSEDKEPDSVDGSPDNNDCVGNMKGKIEFVAQKEAKLKGNKTTIDSDSGTTLKGQNVDLIKELNNFIKELPNKILSDIANNTVLGQGTGGNGGGPIVTVVTGNVTFPALAQTTVACQMISQKLEMFSGGMGMFSLASRSYTGMSEEEENEILSEIKKNVKRIDK